MEGQLVFPPFNEDWDDLLADADAAEQEVIRTQRSLANLSRDLNKARITPARTAWMGLWSRAWEISNGLRGVLVWPSVVALDALERGSTELELHFSCLGDALATGEVKVASGEGEQWQARAREVLHAYLAWVLHADLQQCEQMLSRGNVQKAYDPQLARQFLARLGGAAEAWQRSFGEVEELSDQEAELDRRRGVAVLEDRQRWLLEELRHPALADWHERIRRMTARTGKEQNRPHLTLHELLFDSVVRSAKQQMRQFGREFGYSIYQKNSQGIHGNSFERFVIRGADGITPRLVRSGSEAAVVRLAHSLRLSLLPLELFRMALLDE